MPVVYTNVVTNESREATTLEQFVWFEQNRSMWSQEPMRETEPPAAPATKAAAKPKA